MASLGDFNANNVPPTTGAELLPAAKNVLVGIIESKRKETNGSDGEYLHLTFEILDGEHKNRKVPKFLHMWNKSAEAVRIANGQMSAICHACKRVNATDSCELHNIPIVADIICKKRKDTGEMVNDIVNFRAKEAAAAPASAATGGDATPPWKRK